LVFWDYSNLLLRQNRNQECQGSCSMMPLLVELNDCGGQSNYKRNFIFTLFENYNNGITNDS
jgi:hypothetical protein